MDLAEAIRRNATLPAFALQDMCPAMRRKRRLAGIAAASLVLIAIAAADTLGGAVGGSA